jgi:hypothetical protein
VTRDSGHIGFEEDVINFASGKGEKKRLIMVGKERGIRFKLIN